MSCALYLPSYICLKVPFVKGGDFLRSDPPRGLEEPTSDDTTDESDCGTGSALPVLFEDALAGGCPIGPIGAFSFKLLDEPVV
jgi:hypothetical protein